MNRLLNQVAAFHYVTAPNSPTYRAVVQAFHEAKYRPASCPSSLSVK